MSPAAAHSHPAFSHASSASAEFDLLGVLAAQPAPHSRRKQPDRRPHLDPLILETASISGPEITRNHYLHEFYPNLDSFESKDHTTDNAVKSSPPPVHLKMQSRQAPRSVRLQREAMESRNGHSHKHQHHSHNSLPVGPASIPNVLRATQPAAVAALDFYSSSVTRVVCHARTRVPTPHGDVFIHLYKNNKDSKEHLAFVIDKQQLRNNKPLKNSNPGYQHHPIRSRSLDAVWHAGETEQERIVRGAYVGRLSGDHAVPSSPVGFSSSSSTSSSCTEHESPLVRIHSECFTGETIGSQRCDCGEQLDEAFRIMATHPSGRGIIVYLRQEGRGIGLLEKLRAYNLQDLGYDTVSANLMLGHGADMRTYDVAGAILRDLGVENGVRLLTNNPDKIEHVEKQGIVVAERLPMVPRAWRKAVKKPHRGPSLLRKATLGADHGEYDDDDEDDARSDVEHEIRASGVGMNGAGVTRSPELDRYLKTKIEKMGHMLDFHESHRFNNEPRVVVEHQTKSVPSTPRTTTPLRHATFVHPDSKNSTSSPLAMSSSESADSDEDYEEKLEQGLRENGTYSEFYSYGG